MSTFQKVSTNRGSAILAQRAFYIIRRHAANFVAIVI